jgi:hypothetical protein
MAHPSGRAYHIGAHQPLSEHGDIGVVRREQPLHISGAEEGREQSPRRLTPVAPTYRGMMTRKY